MEYPRVLFSTALLVSTLTLNGCTEPEIMVATIEVEPTSGVLDPGETLQLTATARDSLDNVLAVTVAWSSADELVATVTSAGLVAAVVPGLASIAASADGVVGTADIVVVGPLVTVDVSPANASVRVGSTAQLTAIPRDGLGNAITGLTATWSSGSPGVATVDANGLVTGVASGTAIITADVGGTTGVASVPSWVGVTGDWGGGFSAFGGSCGLTLSLTEDALTGTFTGTGDLTGPNCAEVPVSFAGMNNSDVLMFTMSSSDLPDVPFTGVFDGFSRISGAFSGPIESQNFQVFRTSFTPTPPDGAAREGTSGAYSTYASPGR